MSRCGALGNVAGAAPGGSVPPVWDISSVLDEIRWDLQPTANLIDGNNVITTESGVALTFVGANAVNGTIWRLTNALGLNYTAAAVSTVFNTTTRSANNLQIPFGSIFSAYGVDLRLKYTVLHYYSRLTLPVANAGVGVGASTGLFGLANVPSNGTSPIRVRGLQRSATGGGPTQVVVSNVDAGNGSVYTGASPDVIGYTISDGGMACIAGTWGGSWDTTPITLEIAAPVVTSTNPSTLRDTTVLNYISFGTGGVASGMDIVLERTLILAR